MINPYYAKMLTPYYAKMLTHQGPIAEINHGVVPVHYNPGLPYGNKGIDWETGLLLKNFVEAKKPSQIVELGTFQGYSTSWLILGTLLTGHGRVDAYEVFPEGHYGLMWYDQYELPKHRFSYHHIPGGIWTHDPAIIPETIDLLYHDTQHLPGPTKKEMDLLLPRIPVGGVVLVDDMLHPDYLPMQNYFHGLFMKIDPNDTVHSHWKWSVLPLGHGLGIAERLK